MPATLTLAPGYLIPGLSCPPGSDAPRGLLHITARTPPEAASAGQHLCPDTGVGAHDAEQAWNVTSGRKSPTESKSPKETVAISVRRSLITAEEGLSYPRTF